MRQQSAPVLVPSTSFQTQLQCFAASMSSVDSASWHYSTLSSGLVVWGGDEEQPGELALASICRSMLVDQAARNWNHSAKPMRMMMRTPYSIHLSLQATRQLKCLSYWFPKFLSSLSLLPSPNSCDQWWVIFPSTNVCYCNRQLHYSPPSLHSLSLLSSARIPPWKSPLHRKRTVK